jgi:hypothetical protein
MMTRVDALDSSDLILFEVKPNVPVGSNFEPHAEENCLLSLDMVLLVCVGIGLPRSQRYSWIRSNL